MHPDWVRAIRDQCQQAGVAFFFKQWGEWLPVDLAIEYGLVNTYTDTHKIKNFDGADYARVSKHAAGNLLDGRQWLEMPGAKSSQPVNVRQLEF